MNSVVRRTATIGSIAAIALSESLFFKNMPEVSQALHQLYFVPVILSALYEGWIGGGIVGAIVGSATVLPALWGREEALSDYIDSLTFLFTGILVGLLADKERRQKQMYQALAAQMRDVHGKLNDNLEGMKRAERLSAIGQLSAGLAHEIRNPLASISGAASILRRSIPLTPRNERCVDIIIKECDRLNGLLTNFLDFARPRQPHFHAIRVRSAIENVLELVTHSIRDPSITLKTAVPENLPDVQGDQEQLEQVLLNLLINAIEASPPGEAVTLRATVTGSEIAISVVDRGPGVPPANIDRLFDPFFTTKDTGTGLGLPVAHQIVQQMGGSLVPLPNSDQGMTFSILLPIAHTDYGLHKNLDC
jgi:two-component system sensor histidine kinase HydH